MGKQRIVISAGDSGPDIGGTKRIKANFTRPANTTQYTAGDVVGNSTAAPITFAAVVGANGGAGIVVDAVITSSANQSTKANLRLYMFAGTSTLTVAADNTAWAPTDADMRFCIGHAEFSTWEVGNSGSGSTGNCYSRDDALNAPFECLSTADDILGVLVERSTYTPISAERFDVALGIIRG